MKKCICVQNAFSCSVVSHLCQLLFTRLSEVDIESFEEIENNITNVILLSVTLYLCFGVRNWQDKRLTG